CFRPPKPCERPPAASSGRSARLLEGWRFQHGSLPPQRELPSQNDKIYYGDFRSAEARDRRQVPQRLMFGSVDLVFYEMLASRSFFKTQDARLPAIIDLRTGCDYGGSQP